ncbi:glycosyltransferase family 61 protein [Candidatus Dependentiae bacterium]|nr:glycosyltransferase family 61 protein [Candidatus Dependentiae bacterium]
MKIKIIIFFTIVLYVLNIESRIISYKTIPEFLKLYPNTNWIKCTENYAFDYPEFPLYPEYKEKYFPNKGFHSDISILESPDAIISIDSYGYIFINDIFLKEMQVKNFNPFKEKEIIYRPNFENFFKVKGRVAIINHLFSSIYGLFINDILMALALLEIQGIEYDYLWIPCQLAYQKEALDIWGIDKSKIIPLEHGQILSADMIILPTSVSQNQGKVFYNVNYMPDFLIKYVRKKMLEGVKKMEIKNKFPEKIFISRKDANNRRIIPNEDQVFELFVPLGYKRIEFAKLSMAEKIKATNEAKRIVNFLGSGSTNILFASKDLMYYEIQNQMVEATFYYMAHVLGMHYEIINASTVNDLNIPAFLPGKYLPLEIIQNFIKNHSEL